MLRIIKSVLEFALWISVSMCAGLSVAVAQPKSFALLIGVDEYGQPRGDAPRVPNLRGPANDVAEMKQLLIDKYGFSGQGDIVTLIGKQATVAAIETGFREHLLNNAKKQPGATIVFYFSGHGSQTSDKDNDEGDGADETLVAYDSRTAGKADISDDTIETWLAGLTPHTGNVTVIFDSCHSGDGTKSIGLTPRQLLPNPNTDPNGIKPILAKGAAENDGVLRGRSGYAFISGSRAGELSHEGIVLGSDGKGHYRGFMTHYLATSLRLDPSQTYERVVHRIGANVAQHAPSQHPQVYGDVFARFLGASGVQEQPYLKMAKVDDSRHFTLEAGAIHGIGPGTLLAVYKGTTQRLVGETGKKANARVTSVTMSSSTVELLDATPNPIGTDDKVAIVTPAPGNYRMRVLTGEMGFKESLAKDRKVLAGLRELLNGDHLVEQSPAKDALYSIHRGCMNGQLFTPSSRAAKVPLAACTAAYYVAPRDNTDGPVLATIATDADPAKVAQKLATAIALRARQDHLKKIVNLQFPLSDALKVELVVLESRGQPVDRVYPATAVPKLAVGDKYQLRITNDSEDDLYVAVLVLGSSGQTYLYSPSVNGELINKKTSIKVKPIYTAGKPYGLETYKVMASRRDNVDYGVLVSAGTRRTVGKSAFDLLLADYSNANARDPVAGGNLNLDEWVTQSIDTEIVP